LVAVIDVHERPALTVVPTYAGNFPDVERAPKQVQVVALYDEAPVSAQILSLSFSLSL